MFTWRTTNLDIIISGWHMTANDPVNRLRSGGFINKHLTSTCLQYISKPSISMKHRKVYDLLINTSMISLYIRCLVPEMGKYSQHGTNLRENNFHGGSQYKVLWGHFFNIIIAMALTPRLTLWLANSGRYYTRQSPYCFWELPHMPRHNVLVSHRTLAPSTCQRNLDKLADNLAWTTYFLYCIKFTHSQHSQQRIYGLLGPLMIITCYNRPHFNDH
jgi:hypothetical protein